MNDAESTRKRLFKDLGVAEVIAVIVGLLYFTGYYINSVFQKNYGIPDAELLRLEYIKIGFVFWLITSAIVFLPVGAFMLTYRVRRESGLPHFWVGWLGNSLNTTVMLAVPLFLAFFGTRYEWYFPLNHALFGFHALNKAVGVALAVSSFAVIILPFLERVVRKYSSGLTMKWAFRIFVEPVRFGCLFFSTYIIIGALKQIPWLPMVFGRSLSYLAVSIVFMAGLFAAIRWIRHIQHVRGSYLVYALILFGFSFFYYLAIASYVFGVYPSIPCNRGGRMPLTEAYFETAGHDNLFAGQKECGGYSLKGPAYIIDQTDDVIYFATHGMDRWFQDFVTIHSLRNEDVPYIKLERITDGFPRVIRQVAHPPESSVEVQSSGTTAQQIPGAPPRRELKQ